LDNASAISKKPAKAARRSAPAAAPSPAGPPEPLIQFMPFQEEAFWGADEIGFVLWLWRRQAGKTTTLSALALRRMMEKPWRLVTYASASIAVGGEMLIREAQLWRQAIDKWRRMATERGQLLETSADGVDHDAFCDMFEHGKVEARLYHDRTAYSRTRLIAPNPATARGYSGFVMIDEIGFIRALKDLWEAMEPIASRDPDFRVVMCTTPPDDDGHFSFELAVPPEGSDFSKKDARGHWYDSQANVRVHRVDVWDAAAAGVKMFDLRTRQPVTPEQSRAAHIDRDAWDRNYALAFTRGGTSAVSLAALHRAMQAGRDLGVAAENEAPAGWEQKLGDGPVAIGWDLATTEKAKSNPNAIAVVEGAGRMAIVRLVLRFKTADPDRALAIMREIVAACVRVRNGVSLSAKRLCVDGTNERFFAARVRKDLAAVVPVEIVVASESTEYLGETMPMKTYLGSQVVNDLDDGLMTLPESRWLKDDFRLVVREKGGFNNLLDSAGNHGDTFDGVKLARHGLRGRGRAEASAAQVGSGAAVGARHLPAATGPRPALMA
jgi:hypothetical protein